MVHPSCPGEVAFCVTSQLTQNSSPFKYEKLIKLIYPCVCVSDFLGRLDTCQDWTFFLEVLQNLDLFLKRPSTTAKYHF